LSDILSRVARNGVAKRAEYMRSRISQAVIEIAADEYRDGLPTLERRDEIFRRHFGGVMVDPSVADRFFAALKKS